MFACTVSSFSYMSCLVCDTHSLFRWFPDNHLCCTLIRSIANAKLQRQFTSRTFLCQGSNSDPICVHELSMPTLKFMKICPCVVHQTPKFSRHCWMKMCLCVRLPQSFIGMHGWLQNGTGMHFSHFCMHCCCTD